MGYKINNELRLKLYQQGYTDKEMADILGCSSRAIAEWRFRRRLPVNKALRQPSQNNSRVPMEAVLTPSQCDIMKDFLKCYAGFYRKFKNKYNAQIPFTRFIECYRRMQLEKIS